VADSPPHLSVRGRPDLVLFFCYAYPPSTFPGAIRPSHFSKYLQRFGYNVKVITASEPEAGREEVIFVPDRYTVPNRSRISGLAEILLRRLFFPCDAGIRWSADAFRAAESLVRSHPNAVLFSTFPPLSTHLAALRIKRKYGIRWIADFRDPLAGSPSRVVSRRLLRVLASVTDRTVQNAIFRHADVLIANTDTVLDRWRNQFRGYASKMVHIWNGFDEEEMLGAAPKPVRHFKVIAHVGSIYTGRHPVPLLESIDRLSRAARINAKELLVHLVGYIGWDQLPNRELFERMSGAGILRAPGIVPLAEAHQIMSEADYLLILDVCVPGAGQQLPSKLFEYIPIGRPILAITTRNSPTERVLASSGIPYACIYSDSTRDEVDRAVLELLSMPSDPVRPSSWFLQNFSAVNRARTLARFIGS
jgi:hypothetical protein